MAAIFTKPINRKRYFVYLILCILGIVGISFVVAELGFQTSSGLVSTLTMQKLSWMPFLFAMVVLMIRRRVDILSKESSLIENLVIALLMTGIFTFLPAARPKYLVILTLIVGLIPKLKKKEEAV